MKQNIWKRLTATSFSNRYYQVTNGFINGLFGRHLRITHLVEYPRCGGTWIRHLLQDSMEIPQYAYDRLLSKNTIIQCHKLPSRMIRRAVVVCSLASGLTQAVLWWSRPRSRGQFVSNKLDQFQLRRLEVVDSKSNCSFR